MGALKRSGSLICYLSRIRVVLLAVFCAAARANGTAQESVSLGWVPSPAPQVAGYTVCYGTTSQAYGCRFDAGTNTIVTITNLTEGLTYYFVAVAVASNGNESSPSNEISYSVPDEPPAFSSIDFQNGRLVLAWNSVPG